MLPLLLGLDLWRWGALAAVAAAIFLAGVSWGISHEGGKQLERVVKEAHEMQKVIVKQGEVTFKTVVRYRDRVREIEVAREKRDEVEMVPDTQCDIPLGFVLKWDSANTASIPDTTARDLRGATELTLRDVAAQKEREASICLKCEESLIACRGWIRDQYEATNGVKLDY